MRYENEAGNRHSQTGGGQTQTPKRTDEKAEGEGGKLY